MIPLLLGAAALALCMGVLFVIAMAVNNNGVADIGYGIAFIVLTLTVFFVSRAGVWEEMLLAALPLVWGVRLCMRIARRNLGKPEDFRYRAWREEWGRSFVVRSFFQIYLLQGLVIYLVASPIILAYAFPGVRMPAVFYAGIFVWLVGFLCEAIGDHQLDVFLSRGKAPGAIMQEGLWRYSRHPNYFGESLVWLGIAIAASGLSSVALFGFLSPLLITGLLLFVSGVPLVEKRWAGNPVWEAYASRTSVFFPLPPKRL